MRMVFGINFTDSLTRVKNNLAKIFILIYYNLQGKKNDKKLFFKIASYSSSYRP